MRSPRPRFTLRRLMVAVALAAVCLTLAPGFRRWTERRRHDFTIMALEHDLRMTSINLEYFKHNPQVTVINPAGSPPGDPRPAYHQAMETKYIWAARYPWLPVWPDPPEPKWP
jgi:hypothetical protein